MTDTWPYLRRAGLVCATVFLVCSVRAAAATGAESPDRGMGWTREAIELYASLPIQDGGRVKPISTFAGFKLLKLNGRRKCRDLDGRTLKPTEWLMDCLYFPELARHYRVFLVNDDAVLDAIGVAHEGRKRRDRYSYDELVAGRERLMEMAERLAQAPAQSRSSIEVQLVHLANNLLEFEQILEHLDFARHTFDLGRNDMLGELVVENRYSAILRSAPTLSLAVVALDRGFEALEEELSTEEVRALADRFPEGMRGLDDAAQGRLLHDLQVLLHEIDVMGSKAGALAVFPPRDVDDPEWYSPGGLVAPAFFSDRPLDEQLEGLAVYEDLARVRDDPARFEAVLRQHHDAVVELARRRGEYGRIPLEVAFYKANLLYASLVLFVLAFLAAAVTWLGPRNRLLYGGAMTSLILPEVLLIAAIALRCVIRGRPPVSTLYETILFVTAVCVAVAFAVELIDRHRIALSVGAVLGALGMFLAYKYETKEGVDTMPSLVAVLDANFWLSTHVVTVTMGYAAGLLSGAFAHVYVLCRLIGRPRPGGGLYPRLAGMVYGTFCFSLVFSVVGTVFGGIWAAESWGRFWGWDPKENGALMIVLWELTVLHARKGGYIDELGLSVAAVFNAVVVGFSWWGINLLGVGLHSYGHISGIFNALAAFFVVEGLAIGAGVFVWVRDRRALRPSPDGTPAC